MGIFNKRVNYKPFEYDSITKPFIDSIWASHWTVNEFGFQSDVQDFKTKLTKEEQEVIKRAALLISQVEVAVKAFWGRFGEMFPKPEIADVGATFSGNEIIHSRAYAQILEVLGLNEEFQNMLASEVIEGRVKYLNKYADKVYDDDRKMKIYSTILFTLFTENTSLFSQFFVLLGFNRFNNVMKDVSNIVQYTSKEEQVHALFGITIVNQVRKEHPELFDKDLTDKIIEEAKEAVKAETEVIKWMLNGFENEFLSEEILVTFVKSRLNKALEDIQIDFQFEIDEKTEEKIIWMEEEIMLPENTDFFFKKPVSYGKKTKSFSEEDLF